MIHIFGHKNPDTDSVCSAIALSKLKNQQGMKTTPGVLGELNRESEFVLNHFEVEAPRFIEDVKTQVSDLEYEELAPMRPNDSILRAYKRMEEERIRTLPICNEEDRLLGVITMKDVAMGLIHGHGTTLKSTIGLIMEALDGKLLSGEDREVEGRLLVMALYHKTVEKEDILDRDCITIVGDNYPNIELCIQNEVQLIVVTGNHEIPEKYLEMAKEKSVPIISVAVDTYKATKIIDQCNYISKIMVDDKIVRFKTYDYLDEVQEVMLEKRHTNYPVVGRERKYLGLIGRSQMISPRRKNVILVDHNEYGQSALGIEEANILEIVDHHKIGSIRTAMPISFRNMPVGSTCTIVYQMFKEAGLMPDYPTAGLLMSGILSDTLYFKSPTTSELDRIAIRELNESVQMDMESYVLNMFKAGTSLEGQTVESIFNTDFKEFELGKDNYGIAQVFTLDIDDVFNRKEAFLEYIEKLHGDKGYCLTLLMITDIMKEGSYLLYKSDVQGLVRQAFEIEPEQGVFVSGLVSRKKQGVPAILEGFNRLKV